ncbi:MAG: gamma-glutamylcyclotransferase family protein [Alphaproteobacteria bacterium]
MRFFFYGTLLDPALRGALCPAATGWSIRPAELAEYRRGRRADLSYPFLLPSPGARTAGVVAGGVAVDAAAVLTLYEGEGYRCVLLRPATDDGPVDAWTFLPRRHEAADHPWSLARWQREHRARTIDEIRRWRRSLAPATIAAAAALWRRRAALSPRVPPTPPPAG